MKNGDQLFHLAPERRLWLAYAGLLGLLAWFCFGDLRHHLIETHDGEHFRDNARISEDWTYFFSPDKEQASGRLLYEFVSFLFYLIWGADPGKYHLLAVAGHVAVSLLLAVCFRATGCNIELALVAGLVFLVNVAHFRAIHWLSGLNYVIGLGCALLALLSFARSADGQRRRWLAICYASLACGALSHLAGLMAWPFCVYWAWSRGRDLRRALRDLLPFALPLVPVLALIARSTSEETSTAETLQAYPSASVFDLVTSTLRSGLWLCSRLLTTAHWLPPRAEVRQDWELALGAAMTGALVYWIWRRRDPVAVWSAWTIALLVPFALIAEKLLLNLPFGPSRYLYFASAGSSLLLAWGLQRIGLGLGAWGRPFLALGLSGLMAVSYVGLQRAEGLTFYASARSYLVRGEEDTALNLLEKALAAGQDAVPRAEIYARLCLTLLARPDLGAGTLESARAEFPDHPPLALYAMVVQSLEAPGKGAIPAARMQAIRADADLAELAGKAYYNAGRGCERRGDMHRAALAYQRSLEFIPDRREVMAYLGEALWKLERRVEATAMFLRLVRLHPTDPAALYNAALIHHLQGHHGRAAEFCRRALAIEDSAETRRLLAASIDAAQ